MLRKLNTLLATVPKCSTFVELLRYKARSQPDRKAFIFLANGKTETATLTNAQLDQQAQRIAAYLQSFASPGDRALLLYPPGLDFICAFLGCLYAGVIAVPAYPPRPNRSTARVEAIAIDAQPKIALTTASVLEQIAPRLANSLTSLVAWLATDNLGNFLEPQWQDPGVDSDTLALLQYTSGSTGTPKGVMISHRHLLHNSRYIQQAFELTPESISVCWLPHFHDMGLIDGILQPLYTGFLGVLMPPIAFLGRPLLWLEAISRYRATHSGGPNFAYDLCWRKTTPQDQETLDLSSWQTAYSGAEPIHQETLDRFAATFQPCKFQIQFWYPCYGLAEATLMVTGGQVAAQPVSCSVNVEAIAVDRVEQPIDDAQPVKRLVSCGRVWLDTEVIVVNPELLTRCPSDRIGEIWISGSSVAQGYWNRPQETQQTFGAYLVDTGEGPFLRTGDLGFVQNGELFVTGRLKDLMIIKGRNFYPQDIELTVARSHPAFRPGSGAAFSISVEGEEKLIIVQEVERFYLRKLDVEQAIENICQAMMAEHELQVFDALLIKPGSLPKTSSGKVQRYLCRQYYEAGTLAVLVNKVTNAALGKNRRKSL